MNWTPRYDGDTVRQFLLDTECAGYEGDGTGMVNHLRAEHGVETDIDPWCQTEWVKVAELHVTAHMREHIAAKHAELESRMPKWTHTVTVTWKVLASDDDEAWDIGEAILTSALADAPDIQAIHDDTTVSRIRKGR